MVPVILPITSSLSINKGNGRERTVLCRNRVEGTSAANNVCNSRVDFTPLNWLGFDAAK